MNPFEKNRMKLEKLMPNNSLAILFSGTAPYKRGDEQYPFSPDRNFYYVTGITRENCILCLHKQENELSATLYIPRDNGEMAKWVGANMTSEEAKTLSAITNICPIDTFKTELATTLFKHNINKVFLDLENRDWEAVLSPSIVFANELKMQFPALTLHNLYPIFSDLRLIKDDWELERMHRAMRITENAFLSMMQHAKAGMMEYEIEAYFDFVLTKSGVRQKAFQTIAASGKNATILHYMENNQKTKDGDLVLVDAGAQVDWYNGDITRTFPVNGKFTERQKMVYNIVLEGQQKVIDAIQPDLPFSRLNEILKEHYATELQKIGLITSAEEVSKYYYHGVSHYLGAETHDIGRYFDRKLQPGMVLTVEPGLYIEEWEIGIRIEDDVLVTETGASVMTDLIRTVEDIENFMAKGDA